MVGMVALISFDSIAYAAIPPLLYVALSTIEGQFATPVFLGRRLELNSVAIFICVALWGWLWGIVGSPKEGVKLRANPQAMSECPNAYECKHQHREYEYPRKNKCRRTRFSSPSGTLLNDPFVGQRHWRSPELSQRRISPSASSAPLHLLMSHAEQYWASFSSGFPASRSSPYSGM